VGDLEVAWTYRHGDVESGGFGPLKTLYGSSGESTPLVVDGRLLYSTPLSRVIALDPLTGRELWTFDPEIDPDDGFSNMMISRGVAY
jgi:glucose dehydrogenase